MKYFKVIDKSITVDTGGYNPDDSWSRESTSTEHQILGVTEVDENSYHDLVANDVGPYYLLYVLYDTGDSFGRDEGEIEFVYLHTDLDVAKENAQRIRKHSDTKGKEFGDSLFSILLLTDSREQFNIHVPWNGYFEYLVSIEIMKVEETVKFSY